MHDQFALGACSERIEVAVREDWKEIVRDIQQKEIKGRVETGIALAEVSALAIGQFSLVGLPAEVFTTPARSIQEHSPFEITSVMSHTNGAVFYLPGKAAYFKESNIYGVVPSIPSMVEPGSDSLFVEAAARCLRLAKKRIPLS